MALIEDQQERGSFKQAKGFFQTYEISFILMCSICNFGQGFKRLIDLGLYSIFKSKLGLQPTEIELLLGIINFPWVVKILFAVVIDNLTFCGSRRKSYLIASCAIFIASLVMLMAFSVKFGKVFITSCVFITQVCMTICDAISDALVVQSSRLDPIKGADNLNSMTMFSFSFGGIVGCGVAAFIEYHQYTNASKEVQLVDPNLFFGIYTLLIVIMTVSVATLSRNMEPECILIQRSNEDSMIVTSEEQAEQDQFLPNLEKTFRVICYRMSHREISMALLYFVIQGLLVPNYDDLHYIFLTEKCHIQTYMYDALNLLTYIGTLTLTLAFNLYLAKTMNVRDLIQVQLYIVLAVTVLQTFNALRLNERIPGIRGVKVLGPNLLSDVLLNSVCFFFGAQATQCFASLPMQVALTPCIPDNVEAAMTALITGIFVFSSDVGCKLSGSGFCWLFGVSNENLDRYWIVLAAKCPCILLVIFATYFIPENKEISKLAVKLNNEDRAGSDAEDESLMAEEKVGMLAGEDDDDSDEITAEGASSKAPQM